MFIHAWRKSNVCFASVKIDRILCKENIDEDTARDDMDLPFYNFDIIACATNNFSIDNKLGEGGFGEVYKVTYRKTNAKGGNEVLLVF